MKSDLGLIAVIGIIAYFLMKQVGDMGKGVADAVKSVADAAPKIPDINVNMPAFPTPTVTGIPPLDLLNFLKDLNLNKSSSKIEEGMKEVMVDQKKRVEQGLLPSFDKFLEQIPKVKYIDSWISKDTQDYANKIISAPAGSSPYLHKSSSVVSVASKSISDAPSSAFDRPQNIDTNIRAWAHTWQNSTKTFTNRTFGKNEILPSGWSWGFR